MVATAAGNKVSKHLHGGGLKSYKLRMRVKFNILVRTNIFPLIGFLHLQLIHILALSPQVTSILHGYLQSTYRCGTRILSAMVWSQGGADYTSPFPEHNYIGVVVQGFRSSCCYSRGLFGRVTQTSLVRVLMHKLIALPALARWRQCTVTQHVNNQPPSW